MPFPFQIIATHDPVYTFSGMAVADRFYKHATAPLLALSEERLCGEVEPDEVTNSFTPEALKKSAVVQEAIHFTQTYLGKKLAADNEEILKWGLSSEFIIAGLFPRDKKLPQSARALIEALDKSHEEKKEAGVEERLRLIRDFIGDRANKAISHFCEKGDTRHQKKIAKRPNEFVENLSDISFSMDGIGSRLLSETFSGMPEWLQVLVQDKGCYATIAAKDSKIDMHIGGRAFGHKNNSGLPWIYLNPLNFVSEKVAKNVRKSILQEELLHNWEEYAYNADQKANSAPLDLGLAADFLKKRLKSRWAAAAAELIEHIDADPEHPALQLIKKTQPSGGSLMSPAHLRDADFRASELLIDVFDTEIYLREEMRKLGDDPQEKEKVEKKLKETFGEDVFGLSRKFLGIWLDSAATLVEPVVGRDEALRLKAKWEDDPFCHNIGINKRPEYSSFPEPAAVLPPF